MRVDGSAETPELRNYPMAGSHMGRGDYEPPNYPSAGSCHLAIRRTDRRGRMGWGAGGGACGWGGYEGFLPRSSPAPRRARGPPLLGALAVPSVPPASP